MSITTSISTLCYKADLEVTTYRNDPLLRDTKIMVHTISCVSIEFLNALIADYIKKTERVEVNTFSSLILKISVKVLRKYKSYEEEILDPVLINLHRFCKVISLDGTNEVCFYLSKDNTCIDSFNVHVSEWSNYSTKNRKARRTIRRTMLLNNTDGIKLLLNAYWCNLGYSIEFINETTILVLS